MESQSKLSEFVVESKLGEGSFSMVYKVKRTDDGKYYAMKKVKIGQMKQKQKENALNQVRILASINHPNIVNYREAFFDDKSQTLCVVMELADAGDIQKKINEHLKRSTNFNEGQIWHAMIQMSRGLKALHDVNILHRDMKCANVFCTSDKQYKLGDLNVSKVAKRGMARTQTGTPYYTSPQVWNDRPYDAKCDMWSLGCVIYEMITLKPPFRANNLKELFNKIQRGIYEPIPQFYSQQLKLIISVCLKVNPANRISAAELLNHPYVLKNTPPQYKNQNHIQTSKANLLKTIMVPKNLKSLKEALPGSKYDQPIKHEQIGKFRRANSANQIRVDVPQVIQSPKVGESIPLSYALMRRNGSSEKLQQISQRYQLPSKVLPRMQRNRSVDYVRKRIDSSNSINNSNRKEGNRQGVIQKNMKENASRMIQKSKEMPRPISRGQNRQVGRAINRSRQMNPKEIIKPPMSRQNIVRPISRQKCVDRYGNIQPSVNRQRSSSRNEKQVKQSLQQINNKCRLIEQRVKNLMQRKKDLKQQRNPNLPLINQQELYIKYNYQRPSSRERVLSRNKSIELGRQQSMNSNKNDSKKSVERPSSRQRLASLERGNSKQIDKRRYGLNRYNL